LEKRRTNRGALSGLLELFTLNFVPLLPIVPMFTLTLTNRFVGALTTTDSLVAVYIVLMVIEEENSLGG
jgi:hypothetical protein